MKLSDRNWKEFYLSELFEIKGSKTTHISIIKKSSPGHFPYVTTQTNNNAQAGYYDFYTEQGGVLVVDSAVAGFCTYQQKNFTASDHVEKLIPKFKMSRYVALFLSTQINKNNIKKFSYGFKASQSRLKNTSIYLPITSDFQPDYEFMEAYMREKETKLKEQYKSFIISRLSEKCEKPVEPKKWKEFKIDDIFDIFSGKRLIKSNMKKGNVPFVGASEINNGITNFISNINSSTDENVLGVNYNGSIVSNFYHPYKCTFSDDVKKFFTKNVKGNKYIYLFLKNVILIQKNKFMYGYKFNENRMKRQIIQLPIVSSGEPDYIYMEDYMKYLEQKKLKAYFEYLNK